MKLKTSQLIFCILLIEAILVYYFAPNIYNYNYSVYCSIQYFLNIGLFLFFKKKKNYFDFDCIFFTGFFFVTLFYPVFMYENDPTRFFAFKYDFNPNVLPQASALALLGMSSYLFGSFLYIPEYKTLRKYTSNDYIPNNHLTYIAGFTFILYILTGGYAALGSAYSGSGVKAMGIASYVFIFTPAFLISTLVIEFNNIRAKNMVEFRVKNINKVTIFITFIFILMILATGSRTLPMQMILLLMGLFTLLYRQISFSMFLILIFLGMLTMFCFVLFRGYEQDGAFSLVDLAMDLIINNRNSYAAIEYVNINGLTYGMSMSSSLLAPVPFLQNIFINLFGMDGLEMSSSIVITKMTLGEVGELGLGTNIIADIYMSFGAAGVVVLMTSLGCFINIALIKAKSNIYALVCYGVMISYSVFLIRAEFFFFLRFLIWSLIIVYISKLYKMKLVLFKRTK